MWIHNVTLSYYHILILLSDLHLSLTHYASAKYLQSLSDTWLICHESYVKVEPGYDMMNFTHTYTAELQVARARHV